MYKILFEKEESIIKIKLNYNAIAAAIGKWPISKYRKYTKNEVIKDIIEKVSNKRIGEYDIVFVMLNAKNIYRRLGYIYTGK